MKRIILIGVLFLVLYSAISFADTREGTFWFACSNNNGNPDYTIQMKDDTGAVLGSHIFTNTGKSWGNSWWEADNITITEGWNNITITTASNIGMCDLFIFSCDKAWTPDSDIPNTQFKATYDSNDSTNCKQVINALPYTATNRTGGWEPPDTEYGGDNDDEVDFYGESGVAIYGDSNYQWYYNLYVPLTTLPSPNNFTIYAKNTYNTNYLTNFGATVNGTYYSTTGTSLNTTIPANTTGWTITINKTGFESKTYSNYNLSNNPLIANLSPLSIPIIANWTLPLLRTKNNISLNCNYTLPNGHSYSSTTYTVTNTQDLSIWNTSSNQYTINITDFQDGLSYSCNVCSDFVCNDSSNTKSINNDTIDTLFTITAYSYTGQVLSSVLWEWLDSGETSTSNAHNGLLSTFLNRTVHTFTDETNITDYSYLHQHYNNETIWNENQTVYYHNLTPNKLIMSFTQSGSPYDVEGWVADSEKIRRFNETPFIVIQQDLTEGYVHVRFGSINGVNHTQYYEYVNDFETNINEEIEVLTQSDWSAYFRVLDRSNSPIKDATIRAEFSFSALNNWTYHKLMGQRLTDDDGYTFFIADSRTEVLLTITKDGYDPIEQLLTIGDESFTKAEALTFYLTESESGVKDQAWIYVRRWFDNETLDLSGGITAKGRTTASINTDWRIAQGLSARDISSTKDEHDRFTFTLEDGTDYDLTDESDFILYVYLDGGLWNSYTIEYDETPKIRIFQGVSIPAIAFMILWIFLPLIIGRTFKTVKGGVNTFFGVGIFAVLFNTTLGWISVICTIFMIFSFMLGGLIKE